MWFFSPFVRSSIWEIVWTCLLLVTSLHGDSHEHQQPEFSSPETVLVSCHIIKDLLATYTCMQMRMCVWYVSVCVRERESVVCVFVCVTHGVFQGSSVLLFSAWGEGGRGGGGEGRMGKKLTTFFSQLVPPYVLSPHFNWGLIYVNRKSGKWKRDAAIRRYMHPAVKNFVPYATFHCSLFLYNWKILFTALLSQASSWKKKSETVAVLEQQELWLSLNCVCLAGSTG